MKTNFLCPNCHGYISVGENVILTIKKTGWKGGLLLLSPVLGDYTYTHHPSFNIDQGERLEFHCPVCNYDLTVAGADSLAKVILRENDEEFSVVFSKTKGEQSTYKLSKSKIEETFGDDAGRNIDMLNASFFR